MPQGLQGPNEPFSDYVGRLLGEKPKPDLDALLAEWDAHYGQKNKERHPTDTLTARVLDYIGMGFLLVPPEILVLEVILGSGPVNWPLVSASFVGCYIVGAIVLALGIRWQKVSPQLPQGLYRSITTVANSAWVWLAVLVIFAVGVPVLVASFPASQGPAPQPAPSQAAAKPPFVNPVHTEVAKWRLARNLRPLTSALQGGPCHALIVHYQVPYAETYAHDLAEALETAGWKVTATTTLTRGELPQGISLRSSEAQPAHECASYLKTRLDSDLEGPTGSLHVPLIGTQNDPAQNICVGTGQGASGCIEVDIGNEPAQ